MSKYSKEFKKDALRMCERESVSEVSEKLGAPTKALYTWRREERLKRGEAPKGLRPGETPEQGFERLEREMDELREANYILKKAMGFMVCLLRNWIWFSSIDTNKHCHKSKLMINSSITIVVGEFINFSIN